MKWIIENIELVSVIVSIILTAGGWVVSLIFKNKKAGKVLTGISQVVKSFPEYIQMAEKISDNGEEKKTFVMNQAILLCQSIGIQPTEEQLAYFSAIIDDLVALSKTINLYTNKTTTEQTIPGITKTIRSL